MLRGGGAAQIGSALMLAAEAGTSEPQREALRGQAPTRLTRAFTGAAREASPTASWSSTAASAPAAYPEIHI